MEEEKKRVTIDSTSWLWIDVEVVSNYTDDIKIGERKYDEVAECYVKTLKANIPGDQAEDLYAGLQHMHGDCSGDEDCKYCVEAEEG